MAKIGVVGAGSWGIALAKLLHKNGHSVCVWSIIEDEIKMLREKREHVDKLPGVFLPEDMEFTTDLKGAVGGKDIIVLAVPSPFIRSTSHNLREFVTEDQIIVNVAKGIEEATLMTMSEVIKDEIPQAEVTVLSGPSHAEEVGREIPTTIVVGASKKQTAEYVQNVFMHTHHRIFGAYKLASFSLWPCNMDNKTFDQHCANALEVPYIIRYLHVSPNHNLVSSSV